MAVTKGCYVGFGCVLQTGKRSMLTSPSGSLVGGAFFAQANIICCAPLQIGGQSLQDKKQPKKSLLPHSPSNMDIFSTETKHRKTTLA